MLATIVDTADLGKTVLASLVAGVGVTAFFSLMIFGAARFVDLRRQERMGAAAAYAAIGILALLATTAGITAGMVVMLAG